MKILNGRKDLRSWRTTPPDLIGNRNERPTNQKGGGRRNVCCVHQADGRFPPSFENPERSLGPCKHVYGYGHTCTRYSLHKHQVENLSDPRHPAFSKQHPTRQQADPRERAKIGAPHNRTVYSQPHRTHRIHFSSRTYAQYMLYVWYVVHPHIN